MPVLPKRLRTLLPGPRTAVVLAALAAVLLGAAPAQAHEEREVDFPDGSHGVPEYRDTGPDLLVCKTDSGDFARRIAGFPEELRRRNEELFAACRADGHRHLQDAVNAVDRPGMTIAVLPGEYREEPYRAEPEGECARLDAPWSRFGVTDYQVLSWEQQLACPHNQNLVAVLGIRDLQIEGTGAGPEDVVLDAGFSKLNALRADQADGIYLRNFTVQQTLFNAVYVLATDGFVIDRMLGRWNEEYGFLTFASDNGLYTDCEAYGNGDSGIYPGSASDINGDVDGHDVERYAVEITGCRSHHNMVGYSGTAGNSVWVHGNEFDHNQAGASMDSAFPDHPGLPQNHALFENNLIHDNNQNYYRHVKDGTCAKPVAERGYQDGVVCPAVSMPPGSGIITAGGNWNLFRENHLWGHQRAAFYLTSVPAFIREESELGKQTDTSHHNRYTDNVLGRTPEGESRPNKLDVWWDGQGRGNCWQGDTGASNPPVLPACGPAPGEVSGPGSHRLIGEPVKMAQQLVCADYDIGEARVPGGCDWYGARGLARVEVQLSAVIAVVLGLVGGLLWWRRLRTDTTATVAAGLGAAGLLLDVVGSASSYAHTPVVPVALLLTGLWWLGTGLALRGVRPGFAWTTVALGGLTLLDAVDKSMWLIPYLPVSPAWLRGLLALVWVVWAVTVAARRDRPAPAAGGPAP
ncbi:right-handed parallel beta-helix repeat-containing protein, partial [Streptomyces sp. YIM 98790]|uniref:right-handed parallel beta-helix repeat-containing protein n=1 Tax=Streptomyces sp. YIM 98790 TaxID=2689077 RepID=UPI00140A1E8F